MDKNSQNQKAQKIIEIKFTISFLRIMFDLDPSTAGPYLSNIKQVALAHKKIFERGFLKC